MPDSRDYPSFSTGRMPVSRDYPLGARRTTSAARAAQQLLDDLLVMRQGGEMAFVIPDAQVDLAQLRHNAPRRRQRRVLVVVAVPPRHRRLHVGGVEVPFGMHGEGFVGPSLCPMAQRLDQV